jgi:hypothetical protein
MDREKDDDSFGKRFHAGVRSASINYWFLYLVNSFKSPARTPSHPAGTY